MNSVFLESLKNNNFILFPYRNFENGIDKNGNHFNNISELIRKFKSIKQLKEEFSYTTWKYCGMDNEDNFKSNLKLTDENWYYRNNEVKYTLNSFGYRTKEFDEIDWKNSIVIFGCSSVQGIGVDDSHTISSFLEKEINLPIINMGISGSSNEFHIHNMSVLLKRYPKPKAIIFKQTSLLRFPFYHWNLVEHRGTWNVKKQELESNNSNIIIRNVIANNIIENMLDSNTTYINFSTEGSSSELLKQFLPNNNIHFFKYESLGDEYARDLSHTGIDVNRSIAKLLSEILKSKLN